MEENKNIITEDTKEGFTFDDLRVEVERCRLECWKDSVREMEALNAEMRSREEEAHYANCTNPEELRDYGHTWGPGCEPEDKKNDTDVLPESEQLKLWEIYVMFSLFEDPEITLDEILYFYTGKCAWDDEYPISYINMNDLTQEQLEKVAKAGILEHRREMQEIMAKRAESSKVDKISLF